MHPLQIIFLLMFALILLYLFLRAVSWWYRTAGSGRSLLVTAGPLGTDYVTEEDEEDEESADNPLLPTSTTPLPGVAMRNNDDNGLLPGNADNAVFVAQVEAIERVIKSGKIGQAEAIELIGGCSRTSRQGKPYTLLLAELERRRQRYTPLDEQGRPVMVETAR